MVNIFRKSYYHGVTLSFNGMYAPTLWGLAPNPRKGAKKRDFNPPSSPSRSRFGGARQGG
jgi:hypothetical protein